MKTYFLILILIIGLFSKLLLIVFGFIYIFNKFTKKTELQKAKISYKKRYNNTLIARTNYNNMKLKTNIHLLQLWI